MFIKREITPARSWQGATSTKPDGNLAQDGDEARQLGFARRRVGCPHLAQTYDSAPGSVFGGHHSYPGGLPVHVAVNLSSALALADTYRRIYGHSNNAGLPEIVTAGAPTPLQSDIAIDQDTIIAAPRRPAAMNTSSSIGCAPARSWRRSTRWRRAI